MNTKKYRSLEIDVIIFGIGAIGSKLIMFFLLPLYTNELSSAEYGIADLVFTTSELLLPIISIAIYNGLLRFGLSSEWKKEDAFRVTSIVFVIGVIVSIIITPLFSFYEAISDWKWYISAYAIAMFASKNVLINLKINNKNKLYALASITQAFLMALLNIILLVHFRSGIKGYLLSSIIAIGSVSIIFFIRSGINALIESKPNNALFKKMVLYSMPFIMNDLSWWIIHSSDKIMIESMINKDSLGIYAAASKIPLVINVLAGIFGQAWDLAVVKEYERDNSGNFYSSVFQIFCTLVCGAGMVIVTFIKPFMRVYVGKSFYESWQYVPLLVCAAVFYAIDINVKSFLVAMKKSHSVMIATTIAAIINLIINYVSINKIGIWGAVLGTIVAYLILMIVRIRFVYNKMDFNMNLSYLFMLVLILVVHALLVSVGFNIVFESVICIFAYLVVSFKQWRRIFNHVSEIIWRKTNDRKG